MFGVLLHWSSICCTLQLFSFRFQISVSRSAILRSFGLLCWSFSCVHEFYACAFAFLLLVCVFSVLELPSQTRFGWFPFLDHLFLLFVLFVLFCVPLPCACLLLLCQSQFEICLFFKAHWSTLCLLRSRLLIPFFVVDRYLFARKLLRELPEPLSDSTMLVCFVIVCFLLFCLGVLVPTDPVLLLLHDSIFLSCSSICFFSLLVSVFALLLQPCSPPCLILLVHCLSVSSVLLIRVGFLSQASSSSNDISHSSTFSATSTDFVSSQSRLSPGLIPSGLSQSVLSISPPSLFSSGSWASAHDELPALSTR